MNILKAALFSTLLVSTVAMATEQPATTSDMSGLASRTLQADGVTDGRIVEILKESTPLVFTYCRQGSPTLWRYEVLSSENTPDVPDAGLRVVKSQALEATSAACTVAG